MQANDYRWQKMEDGSIQLLKVELVDLESVPKPPIVYKFRNWRNLANPKHDNVLLDNELYIPSPDRFEDVKDCRNPTRYDLLIDVERLSWCKNFFRRQHPRYNDTAINRMAEEWASKPHLADKQWIDKVEQDAWKKYNEFTGILSVTDHPSNQSMWEKYGDSFRGICYGFNTAALINDIGIKSGGLVHYVDELPIIHPLDEFPLMFFKRIYCKERKWDFEEEYRFKTTDYYPRKRKFSRSTLVEVIFGHKMSKEHLNAAIATLSDWQDKPRLFQTTSTAKSFKIIEIDYDQIPIR